MLSLPILDINDKFTNWIFTGVSPEKIRQFDTNLEPIMSNLANGKVILKFNKSVLVKKKILFHCIVNLR